MLEPKVSIALITYNHEKFIEECLESIRQQDYPNIELCISDDCSSDNTRKIVQSYNHKYPGLIDKLLFPNERLGITGNTNNALAHCTGELIVPFSGDDIMNVEKISKQVARMKANPHAVFCYTNTEWFHSNTGKKIFTHFGWLNKPSNDIRQVIKDFCIPATTLMVRRKAIPIGGCDRRLPMASDFMFVIELLRKGEAIYIPEILSRYRKHSRSITSLSTLYEDRFKLVTILREEFPEYSKEIDGCEAIAYYAKVRDGLRGGNVTAIKEWLRIIPYCFCSLKWSVRTLILLKDVFCFLPRKLYLK